MDILTLKKANQYSEIRGIGFNEGSDVVYDRCHRNVSSDTSAINMKTDSGHTWSITGSEEETSIFYRPEGGLRVETPIEYPVIIDDTNFTFQKIQTTSYGVGRLYIKYVDENNHLALRSETSGWSVYITIDGEGTRIINSSNSADSTRLNQNVTFTSVIAATHSSTAESGRRLIVRHDLHSGHERVYGFSDEQWNAIKDGQIGLGSNLTYHKIIIAT